VTQAVTRRKRIAKGVLAIVAAGLVALFAVACVTTDRFRSLGGAPDDATLARMRRSPQFDGRAWRNAEPTELMKVGTWETTKHWWAGHEEREPPCVLPTVKDTAARLAAAPSSGLRITWLGHSTTLVEMDGVTILTDPNWSERASPSTIVGPRRFHPPPLALADLPRVDAVIVSHEHFDHLDMASIRAIAARGATFHVPLGIGAHLLTWGVAHDRIVEHDWWEPAIVGGVGGVAIISTPARHFNGRAPWRTGALWTSWSIVGESHRVFFSGDSGLSDSFRAIGERYGPFDVAMLEIGQYHADWGDIHLGPRGAIEAFAMLRARRLLPIHWGTFSLAYHAWSEPAETISGLAHDELVMPRLGEPFEPSVASPREAWWRDACARSVR
jgi:L-ascorbate metabolism protein UlaG (beta-lactamase superfamily)